MTIKVNPIEITLNDTTTTSIEYDVATAISGNIVQISISGTFDGATVKMQDYASSSEGWGDITLRSSATEIATLIFSENSRGDKVELMNSTKFRFVCLNATANTDIKVLVRY